MGACWLALLRHTAAEKLTFKPVRLHIRVVVGRGGGEEKELDGKHDLSSL
jgi:hypothetical protein